MLFVIFVAQHSLLGFFPVVSVFCSEIRDRGARREEPPEALRSLRALRSNVVISCYGVSPDREDSVVIDKLRPCAEAGRLQPGGRRVHNLRDAVSACVVQEAF